MRLGLERGGCNVVLIDVRLSASGAKQMRARVVCVILSPVRVARPCTCSLPTAFQRWNVLAWSQAAGNRYMLRPGPTALAGACIKRVRGSSRRRRPRGTELGPVSVLYAPRPALFGPNRNRKRRSLVAGDLKDGKRTKRKKRCFFVASLLENMYMSM
jgi:hypothetical protein